MEIPIKITYRNVPKSEKIERLIHKNAEKLERICHYITACRVAIEKRHEHQKFGNSYRVR